MPRGFRDLIDMKFGNLHFTEPDYMTRLKNPDLQQDYKGSFYKFKRKYKLRERNLPDIEYVIWSDEMGIVEYGDSKDEIWRLVKTKKFK